MKHFLTIVLVIAAAVFAWVNFGASYFADKAQTEEFVGVVVGVIDGDSIKLRTDAGVQRIELTGVDAPEIGQTFGEISKNYLVELIDGREVKVEVDSRNSYGDLVGEVFLNSVSINRLMLTDGFAWAKRGVFEDPTWAGLESLARNKGFGLWRDGTPEAPWEFRAQAGKS